MTHYRQLFFFDWVLDLHASLGKMLSISTRKIFTFELGIFSGELPSLLSGGSRTIVSAFLVYMFSLSSESYTS